MSALTRMITHLWPTTLVLAAVAWVIATELNDRPDLHAKYPQEVAGIVLSQLAFVVALLRLLVTRTRFAMILTALSATLALRELHFEWTTLGVYIMLAGVVAWAVMWQKSLNEFVDRTPSLRTWIILAGIGYVLSQAVARRAVQHIVGEDSTVGQFLETRYGGGEQFPVYGDLEEFLENAAHFTLLCVAMLAPWRRELSSPPDPPQ